jgi:hypothetical protein
VDGLIALGAVRDAVVQKRIHPIYLWTLPILIVMQTIAIHIADHGYAPWLAFAHWLMR